MDHTLLPQGVEQHSFGYPLPWYLVVQPRTVCSGDACLIFEDGFIAGFFLLDILFFAALGYLSLLMLALGGILRTAYVPVEGRARLVLVLAALGLGLLTAVANWQWSKDVHIESYVPWFLAGSAVGFPLSILVYTIAQRVGSHQNLTSSEKNPD